MISEIHSHTMGALGHMKEKPFSGHAPQFNPVCLDFVYSTQQAKSPGKIGIRLVYKSTAKFRLKH